MSGMDLIELVPRGGFEPPTCPLGGDRAIHCATGAPQYYATNLMTIRACVDYKSSCMAVIARPNVPKKNVHWSRVKPKM